MKHDRLKVFAAKTVVYSGFVLFSRDLFPVHVAVSAIKINPILLENSVLLRHYIFLGKLKKKLLFPFGPVWHTYLPAVA